MAKIYIGYQTTVDHKYVIMVREPEVGFGFYNKDGRKTTFVREAIDAYKFNTEGEADDFITTHRQLLINRWKRKITGTYNVW